MNPYDFVRLDWDNGVPRRQAPMHDRYTGVSGRIEGTITTLTPLFIPGGGEGTAREFRRNGHKQPIIPGSSLKGLVRSLVETIGPGCWWLTDRDHAFKLPHPFQQCRQTESLCPACRMFGLIQGGVHLGGHVGFHDGVCAAPTPFERMFTPILSNPKPRHTAWYFAGRGGLPTGRKYFFHSTTVLAESGLRESQRYGTAQNIEIAPIGAGSVFTFSAHFANLAADDLDLLLYALALEEGMRHKIGYAKPAGLGSIAIKLTKLETRDMAQRYSTAGRPSGADAREGDALDAYLHDRTQACAARIAAVTLSDLRRIWAWPPPEGVTYAYPTQDWFRRNPTEPISAT